MSVCLTSVKRLFNSFSNPNPFIIADIWFSNPSLCPHDNLNYFVVSPSNIHYEKNGKGNIHSAEEGEDPVCSKDYMPMNPYRKVSSDSCIQQQFSEKGLLYLYTVQQYCKTIHREVKIVQSLATKDHFYLLQSCTSCAKRDRNRGKQIELYMWKVEMSAPPPLFFLQMTL